MNAMDTFSDGEATWLYIELFRLPVQMLYSQLNPFLYIVIFKRPAEHVFDRIATISNTLLAVVCFRKKQISDRNETKTPRKKLRSAEGFLAAMILIISPISLFGAAKPYVGFAYEEFPKFDLEKSKREIAADRRWNARVNLEFKDVVNFVEPRQKCWELKGSLRLDFRRCFKLLTNVPPIPFYEEQIEICANRAMTLVYPRSYDEMVFIADLLNAGKFGIISIKDRLFCGLEQINQSETSTTYRSLDGKFTVSSPNDEWFVDYSRANLTKRSPDIHTKEDERNFANQNCAAGYFDVSDSDISHCVLL